MAKGQPFRPKRKPRQQFKVYAEEGPRFDGDPEYHRPLTRHLTTVMSLVDGHRPRQWGFTIIRTAYDDHSQFRRSMSCILKAIYAFSNTEQNQVQSELQAILEAGTVDTTLVPPKVDIGVNREFIKSYYYDLINNRAKLHGASTEMIRETFRQWLVSHKGNAKGSNMRYVFVIVMDKETMDQLDRFKDAGSITNAENRTTEVPWVKVLDAAADVMHPYRISLYGPFNIVQYWFDRSLSLQSPSLYLRESDGQLPILRYGALPKDNGSGHLLQKRARNVLAKLDR